MSILTPERLAHICNELERGHIANYPSIIKASHEALREVAVALLDYIDHPEQRNHRAWVLIEKAEKAGLTK